MAQASPAPNPAEAYERAIVQNMLVPWTADLVPRAAPQAGERVLDPACGTGIVTRSVAPLVGSRGKVVGLDISPPMLEVARSLAPTGETSIEWHEGSGTEMPFPDGSFDLVLCQQGLQFFPDHGAGLKEIRRVLASGGRVVLSVWRDLERQDLMKAIDGVVSQHLAPGALGPPFSLSDATGLEQLAVGAGLAGVDVQQVDLTLRIKDPDAIVPMMMQGAAAVLPQFGALSPEERQPIVGRMRADLLDAIAPLISAGELVTNSSANVLTAQR